MDLLAPDVKEIRRKNSETRKKINCIMFPLSLSLSLSLLNLTISNFHTPG
jgi:hypothetical protein